MGALRTNPEYLDAIENLIDRSTLFDVLESISDICHSKAEHIRSAWGPGDERLAKAWDRAGKDLAGVLALKSIRAL